MSPGVTAGGPGQGAKSKLQRWLLAAYGRLARSGVVEHPVAQRVFEGAYEAYKTVLEAGPVRHLRPYAPPGALVVDVGANLGFFTVRFARWVGPGGRVVAVEPEAGHVARLVARLRRREMDGRVTVVPAAATNSVGRTHLVINQLHPMDHRIGAAGVEVAAVTVDSVVDGDPRPVTLIKVDVQGAEQLVLDGARQTIARHRPALFVEVDPAALERFGTSAAGLLADVEHLGYRAHFLTRAGVSAAVDAGTVARARTATYGDVLFLPCPPG